MMDDLLRVTPEEEAHYDAFCRMLFDRIQRVPPDVLWYYTSADTFAEIVRTKQIWSTQGRVPQ